MALPKHRKLIWLCTLLGVFVSALACLSATFVVQQYEGAPLPTDRIAILRLVGGDEAYLASLDGEGLDFRVEGRTDRIHVEMLPGDHELGIARHPNGRVVYRRFAAKAGVTYQPKVLHNRLARGEGGLERWTAGVFEVDPATDELVRDVSVSPYSPLPPPPVPSSPATSPDGSDGAPPASPAAPSAPSELGPPAASTSTETTADVSAPASAAPEPPASSAAPSLPPSGSGTPSVPPAPSAPMADPLDDRLPKPPAPPAPTSPPVPTSPPAPAPPVPTSPPPPVPTTPPHPGPPPQPKSK